MATLTKEQRDLLPSNDFADRTKRLFPICDQQDVDTVFSLESFLESPDEARMSVMEICERKGLTPPSDWAAQAAASFAAKAAAKTAKGKAKKDEDDEEDEDEDDDDDEDDEDDDDDEDEDEDDDEDDDEDEDEDDDEDEEEPKAKAKDEVAYEDDGGDEGGADMSATFSLNAGSTPEADGYVIRRAPVIFRVGDYRDKDFSMNHEEMTRAVAHFSPVDIDLEHKPSVLDRKLGRIIKVGSDATGCMFGEAEIPVWLDAILEKDNRKLSATFDRKTKLMTGCSLVRNPRVTDAQLMAAFSAFFDAKSVPLDKVEQVSGGPAAGSHADPDGKPSADAKDTPAGSMGAWRGMMPKAAYEKIADKDATAKGAKAIKDTHDACAEAGACDGIDKAQHSDDPAASVDENERRRACFNELRRARRRFLEASFSYDPEAERLKAVHDMTCQGTSHCATFAAKASDSKESGPTYPKQRDDKGIGDSTELNKKPKPPKDKPEVMDPLQAEYPVDTGTTTNTSDIVQGKSGKGRSKLEGFSADAPAKAESAETKALREQVARLQRDKIASDAASFADAEIAAKRAVPAERDALVAEFTIAAGDDLVGGTASNVTFDNMSFSRVDFLRRRQMSRVPHALTSELVKTAADGLTVGFSDGRGRATAGVLTDARRKELLSKSQLGRDIIEKGC